MMIYTCSTVQKGFKNNSVMKIDDQRGKETQGERETVEEKQNIKSRYQGAPGFEGLRRRRNGNELRVCSSVELMHSVLIERM